MDVCITRYIEAVCNKKTKVKQYTEFMLCVQCDRLWSPSNYVVGSGSNYNLNLK